MPLLRLLRIPLPASILRTALALAVTVVPLAAQDDASLRTTVPLDDLSAFRTDGSNWTIAGSVYSDRHTTRSIETTPGTGVLVNTEVENAVGSNLFTAREHGDLELELDVLVPAGSNSGIYLQGRYEIQIFDSWGVREPRHSDCGGIYQRWDEARPEGDRGYEGHAPATNVSRAPGLWQHFRILFRAPRFDDAGQKTENARFLEVHHNGVLVHEDVELTGPTRAAAFEDEAPSGPLMFQGDHGPVAFRNIRYARAIPAADTTSAEATGPPPYPVEIGDAPYVFRSFVAFEGGKRTHAVSVGDPAGPRYAMDLNRMGLLYLWKGPFLDAGPMWHRRGQAQTPVLPGSAIPQSGAPVLAPLPDSTAPWPDSLDAGSFRFEAYTLDPDGRPVFSYRVDGTEVSDLLRPEEDGRTLRRTLELTAASPSDSLWCLMAEAASIEQRPDGAFSIDDATYLVEPDSTGAAPLLRTDPASGNRQLLLPVLFQDGRATVRYTLVW